MARLFQLIVIVVLVWVAYRLITRGRERARDKVLPAPAACPRCRQMLTLAELSCANCGRQGRIRRTVHRERGSAETRFDCENCRTTVATMACPQCQTNVAGVFSVRDG
jgi:hypothetical protein